jgi:uncharacterized protein DUF1810
MAERCAIRDDQARRYLDDPILGSRLRHLVKLMIDQKAKSALEILGSPDNLKFRSCLTLFREAALENSGRFLFTQALGQFYGGQPDDCYPETLRTDLSFSAFLPYCNNAPLIPLHYFWAPTWARDFKRLQQRPITVC